MNNVKRLAAKVANTLLTTKSHVEMLASKETAVRENLLCISETLSVTVDSLETISKLSELQEDVRVSETTLKNRLYHFLLKRGLIEEYIKFTQNHKAETYKGKSGFEILTME